MYTAIFILLVVWNTIAPSPPATQEIPDEESRPWQNFWGEPLRTGGTRGPYAVFVFFYNLLYYMDVVFVYMDISADSRQSFTQLSTPK